MAYYKIGDLVSFSYPAVHLEGTQAHDKHPEVLILHPNWEGLVHGLNFNYLTRDEINILRMLIDPMYEMRYRTALKQRNPTAYAEMDKIISEPGAYRNTKINSPHDFYRGVIRPFIITRNWDPYRRYRPEKMRNIRIVQNAAHMMGEDSMAKFKKEQEEMANMVSQAIAKAKTREEKEAAEKMKQELEKNKSLSQRQSVLKKFSDFIQFWRGPRIKF